MALVVEILGRAARECSVSAPPSWVTAADLTSMQIKDMLETTILDILDRIDVPQPVSKAVTLVGDGSESYALPADFYRVHRSDLAVYEALRNQRGAVPVSDDGQWEYLRASGFGGGQRFFRIRGSEGAYTIDLLRQPGAGEEIIVSYVSREWLRNQITLAQGGVFGSEDDECLFPRRLVEKGIVWRFLERKGMDYASAQVQYEMLLSRFASDGKTVRAISFGPVARVSPWDIPVPDYIPPA